MILMGKPGINVEVKMVKCNRGGEPYLRWGISIYFCYRQSFFMATLLRRTLIPHTIVGLLSKRVKANVNGYKRLFSLKKCPGFLLGRFVYLGCHLKTYYDTLRADK